MKQISKQTLLEQIVYLIIWIFIGVAPIVSTYSAQNTLPDHTTVWKDIMQSWIIIAPFFVLFLLNNFILIPKLFLRKNYLWYTISIILTLFILFKVVPESVLFYQLSENRQEQFMPGGDMRPHGERLPHPEDGEHSFEMRPPLPDGHHNHRQPMPPRMRPNTITFINLTIAILLIGFNLTIKLFIKSLRDEEVLKDLEHQKLESELQYLKYQLNPHFFINTLNNIHALIDIDSRKAKTSIIELSKLMRYVLYESNKDYIELTKEITFLQNYIELMRLRFTESLNIQTDFPLIVPEVKIPPLLLISLLENAFKHGVSYREASFIHICLKIDDGSLIFKCSNSKHRTKKDEHHGVGLENVKKRLQLLFGNNYTYTVNENENEYNVSLNIPLNT